jgi:hypothetical protein
MFIGNCLVSNWSTVSLFRILATCFTYRNHDHHLSDGFPHTEKQQQRFAGNTDKVERVGCCQTDASNRIVSIEDLSEEELVRLNKYYTSLAELTKREENLNTSLSIEDTTIIHDEKESIKKEIDEITK